MMQAMVSNRRCHFHGIGDRMVYLFLRHDIYPFTIFALIIDRYPEPTLIEPWGNSILTWRLLYCAIAWSWIFAMGSPSYVSSLVITVLLAWSRAMDDIPGDVCCKPLFRRFLTSSSFFVSELFSSWLQLATDYFDPPWDYCCESLFWGGTSSSFSSSSANSEWLLSWSCLALLIFDSPSTLSLIVRLTNPKARDSKYVLAALVASARWILRRFGLATSAVLQFDDSVMIKM